MIAAVVRLLGRIRGARQSDTMAAHVRPVDIRLIGLVYWFRGATENSQSGRKTPPFAASGFTFSAASIFRVKNKGDSDIIAY